MKTDSTIQLAATATDAYNFLASWQLLPENGTYGLGARPKSAILRIEFGTSQKMLIISMNWLTIEDHAFAASYQVWPDNEEHPSSSPDLADAMRCTFKSSTQFEIEFQKDNRLALHVIHEITPKGFLKVTQEHVQSDGGILKNEEYYHKQLSVLPYSASVSGALIKPNEEGMIKHHALTAMEEQTNTQLTQIRQQIELLAIQAREIQRRKELSMIVYDAQLGFNPVIGQTYYLYLKEDGSHLLSLVSPKEWGAKIPFKSFVASVRLLADHTWMEV